MRRGPGIAGMGGGAVVVLGAILSPGCSRGSPPEEIWRPEPLPRDFRRGDTVPGFVAQAPTAGRADLRARGTHADGRWTVLLERDLAARDTGRDVDLSGLPGGALARFSVAALDGVPGPSEANMAPQDTRFFTLGFEGTGADIEAPLVGEAPRDASGFPGRALVTAPQAPAPSVTLRAAVDGRRLYLLAEWPDGAPSEVQSRWTFDGKGWSRKGGDDQLLFLWDLGPPDPSGGSCALLCHAEDEPRPRMRTLAGRADAWVWSASRTSPSGFADDRSLGPAPPEDEGFSAFEDDPGRACFAENRGSEVFEPAYVSVRDPGAEARALFRSPPGTGTAVRAEEVSRPGKGDSVPGFVLRPPEGSGADVGARSQFAEGSWTVLLSRPLGTGDPGSDLDLSDFAGGGLVYFSVLARDEADGPAGDADADPRALSLGPEGSGADLEAPRATPAGPQDFRGRPLTTVPRGRSPAVTLRAAYDATSLHLLATWKDPGGSAGRTPARWSARRGAWERGPDGEDALAIVWSRNATGCAVLCHPADPPGLRFRGEEGILDAWAWRAGRTDPLGLAEDLRLGGADGVVLPDPGGAPYAPNEDPSRPGPAFIPRDDEPGPVDFLLDAGSGTDPGVPHASSGGDAFGSGPTFVRDVVPIIRGCICHRAGNVSGGLRLDTYQTLMLGGSHRATLPEVVPGNPKGSLLYLKVSLTQPPVGQRMPLGGPYLSLPEIERIRAWIESGALEK